MSGTLLLLSSTQMVDVIENQENAEANTSELSTKLFYGCGAVAYGAKSNGFNYLLLYFYSQVMGLAPDAVSFAIFIALLVDAISDPLVGYWSDNLRTRWGRRHPMMYAAGLPAAFAYYFLWSPPDLNPDALLLYLIGLAILIRTLLTFYEIPSTSLAAELTRDYDERTRFLSFRFFFGWWGGLVMAVLVYLVFLPESRGGLENAGGWRHYGMTAAIVIGLSVYLSALGTHRHIPALPKAPNRSRGGLARVIRELFETLSNRAFGVLFLSGLFASMAAGVNMSLSVYFARHFWELTTGQMGMLQIPYFVSALVALAIAPLLSMRYGKKRAAIGLIVVTTIITPLPIALRLIGWFPDNGTIELLAALAVFYTVDVALMIAAAILSAAMLADVVEDSEIATGRRSEGTFFAASSFTQKAVNGLGVVVAGQILALVDFPGGAKPGDVPSDVLVDFALCYMPTVVGFYLLAVIFLSQFRISREKHQANLRVLAARTH